MTVLVKQELVDVLERIGKPFTDIVGYELEYYPSASNVEPIFASGTDLERLEKFLNTVDSLGDYNPENNYFRLRRGVMFEDGTWLERDSDKETEWWNYVKPPKREYFQELEARNRD